MLFTRSLYLCPRRPTLPHTFARSTIGPAASWAQRMRLAFLHYTLDLRHPHSVLVLGIPPNICGRCPETVRWHPVFLTHDKCGQNTSTRCVFLLGNLV